MGEVIKRGMIQKPAEKTKGDGSKTVIQYGVQSPGASFDRRPECGPAPNYLGPSKMESRSSSINAGISQKKKHKSSGKGQR